eukprot:883256-Pelagomonas_calceolata.AAC.1
MVQVAMINMSTVCPDSSSQHPLYRRIVMLHKGNRRYSLVCAHVSMSRDQKCLTQRLAGTVCKEQGLQGGWPTARALADRLVWKELSKEQAGL